MSVSYKVLTPEYEDRILELEQSSMEHPWDRDSVRVLLTDEFRLAVGAVEDDRLLSYAGTSFVLDEADMGNLATAPDVRRGGLGEGTMLFLFEELRNRGVATVFLEVSEHNLPARKLYEKLDFEEYGIRKNYYGAGNSAILMKKSL